MAREKIFGLRGKIILLSILPSLLVISIVTYLSIRSLNHEIAGDYIKGSRTAINLINNQLKSDEDITNPLLAELMIDQAMKVMSWVSGIAIYAVDGGKTGLIYSSRPDDKGRLLSAAEVNHLLGSDAVLIELRDNDLIEIITPMRRAGSRHVSAIVFTPLAPKNEELAGHISTILPVGIFGFAGLTLILYFALNRIIIGPVSLIRRVARQIAEGDPSARVVMDRHDEIGDLAVDINRMSDSLKARAAMLTKEIEMITVMKSIDRSILASHTLSDLVHAISANIKSIVPADIVTIILCDATSAGFIRLVPSENQQLTREFFLIEESYILVNVYETKRPFMVRDFREAEWKRGFEDRLLKSGILSGMAIPLVSKGNLIGTLNIGSFIPERFNEDHLSFALDIADQAAIAMESSRLHERQKREVEVLSTLLHIGGLLSSTISLDGLLLKILDSIHKLVDVDMSSIMLLDEGKILRIKAARGLDPKYINSEGIKLGEGIAGWAALHGKPLLIQDLVKNGGFINFTPHEKDIYSSMCIPISAKEQVIGVLSISRTSREKRFSEDDLKLMTIFSSQAASAIENARLFDEVIKKAAELKESRFDSIKALAEAIETKDVYTRGHSDRMVEYATRIAERLGLSEQEKEFLRYGAILHDTGKIGIPDHILNKPGRLDKEEFEMMKSHPVKGADIIREISFLAPVVPIVLHHQERYDGTGYPAGLAGEDIPIGARVVSVLDAYDAMTSDRPYRPAPGPDRAIEELRKYSGTQFDPKVVTLFLDILEEERNARGEAGRNI
ncbi:MAG: GAF domain-containing protein [Nitrospirae bacterium]|nr:GAF domain-containing protein [Nitrospirota bacterium]